MRISDWSSDVCSSDLVLGARPGDADAAVEAHRRASAIAPCLVLNLIAAPGRSHRQRASRGSRPAIGSRMMRHISLAGVLARANEPRGASPERSEEHTSELQSLMRISYAGFCLKKQRK